MNTSEKIREAVGVFEDVDAMEEAITELEATAFSRDTISILGNQQAIKDRFGKTAIRPEKAEDDPDAPRQTPVREEEKTIGAGAVIGGGAYIGAVGALLTAGAAVSVPAIITAAAIGGGGGGILAKILGDYFDEQIEQQIEKGGMILWVQTHTSALEDTACDILKKYGAKHVHIHEIK